MTVGEILSVKKVIQNVFPENRDLEGKRKIIPTCFTGGDYFTLTLFLIWMFSSYGIDKALSKQKTEKFVASLVSSDTKEEIENLLNGDFMSSEFAGQAENLLFNYYEQLELHKYDYSYKKISEKERHDIYFIKEENGRGENFKLSIFYDDNNEIINIELINSKLEN